MSKGLLTLLLLCVFNDTTEPLTLQVCCEGYPYGELIHTEPGQTAVWEWQPGHTSIVGWKKDKDWLLWGRLRATRKPGVIEVHLKP